MTPCLTQTEETTLLAQEPTLRRIAQKYAPFNPDDADDIFQAMEEGLIRRAINNPHFLEQKPAYIRRAAQLKALHSLRPLEVYRRFNDPLYPQESREFPHVDMIAAREAQPEDRLVMAETAFAIIDAIRTLRPRERAVATMLYQGFKPSEIASRLHISRQLVTESRRKIRDAAEKVLK